MSNVLTTPVRILHIDNQAMVRAGIRTLIEADHECKIIGEAQGRIEALEAARLQPDIILLELDLGGESAIDFLPELLDLAKGARVLLLTAATDPELHCRALRLGAAGVVLKTEEPKVLLTAIKKVHAGEAWLPSQTIVNILEKISQRSRQPLDPEAEKIETLTKMERNVIAFIGQGLNNKQIAEGLLVSEATVRRYLSVIFNKIGVAGRLQLAAYAFRHGLTTLKAKPAF